MGNIRVYELARELNIKNKELLEQLGKMSISVSNHMSSLDDKTVARVKANLLGNKTDVVEMTRIKPTVIRRRKKIRLLKQSLKKKRPCPPDPLQKLKLKRLKSLKKQKRKMREERMQTLENTLTDKAHGTK
ncbi:MAG: translation initiation factor IF-2 N-terminal domain-containing protein [Proteobacteria bacterium]|nr:translation initiation factor IF-2 N-terminal domain-containing protein [Pseudomonadota bacterium]